MKNTSILRNIFTRIGFVARSFRQTEVLAEDERYFLAEALRRRYEATADIVIRLGAIYHIAMFFLFRRIGIPELVPMVSAFHIGCLLITVPMFSAPFGARTVVHNVGRKYVLPIAILLPPLFYAMIAFMRGDEYGNPRHVLLLNHVYSLSNFVILVHPGRPRVRFLSVLVLSLVSFVAFSKHPVGGTLAAFSSMGVLVSALVGVGLERQSIAVARREYKLMIQAAPAKIVRQSASSQEDLAEVFAPTQRNCVCISSDWRGYQALTASMASQELAHALGAYYEMTDSLLARIFPDGNYYTDWIADELFVVIFAKDAAEEKFLINSALKFSNELIVHKQIFVSKSKLPIHIDVGIASGVALIGMMGPAGHRKATALGDVPGQARRFQSAGKYLRVALGDRDRVIFGAKTLLEISAPFDVHEFDLAETGKIRDVEDSRVFFLDPDSNRVSEVA